MEKPAHACPACGREFKSILDYPRVRVLSFERLPTPEAVDDMSGAAAQKALDWHRRHPGDMDWSRRGINMTPEIARACESKPVVEYLAFLAGMAGQEVSPPKLLPPLPTDGYFKWAYPVPNSTIYLTLTEAAAAGKDERTAEVQIHCEGPTMGSAGGPTLQPLGAIALLRYEGILADRWH